MIRLYQFPRLWGLPNLSNFCLKVETYLRLANIPYKVITISNPSKGPKGKLPFIEDDGKVIADSSFIIEYLKNQYGDVLDQHLTPAQQASGLAIQRLVEEHLYWLVIYTRWQTPEGWQVLKAKLFSRLSPPLKWIIPGLMQRRFKKILYGQGIGRFTDEERYHLGKKDIDAIVSILGDNDFMFGNTPTSIDAIVWSAITLLLNTPIPSNLQQYGKTLPTLLHYDQRMKILFDERQSLCMTD